MSVTWFDNVTLTVEAALSAATGTYGSWDAALWDTATWGPDVTWQDISQWLRTIHIERRFNRDEAVWEAGSASVVLNNPDGRFSPSNLSGSYVTAGITGLRPWRPVRVRATYAGVTYDLYRGYAMDWLETWPDGADAAAIVTVPCVDEMARLAKVDGMAQTPAGAGESTGARIHRLLNAAGHTGTRTVDVGRNTVQATDLSKNVGDELKVTTESEGGGLFIDADGTVVFEQQYALMENTRSNTVQATFVDAANINQGLPYGNVVKSYGGQVLTNIAAFTRVGGTPQVVADATSRALNGDLRYTKTDFVCETDAQAQALATMYVQLHKDAEDRIRQVVLKPRNRTGPLWPQALGRRVRDLVQVIRTPRQGNYTISQTDHIAGIVHDITGDDWTTTYDLWSAAVYQRYATSRWDVAQWDQAAWFF